MTMALFEPQVVVIDFHHARGPEVESWITDTGRQAYLDNDWGLLPFLALSDGAHASIEDFAYFTLVYRQSAFPTIAPTDPTIPASNWRQSPSPTREFEDVAIETPTPTIASRNLVAVVDGTSIFGISCTRQIRSDLLKVRGKDVTRSTVQKAVVVLLGRPAMLGVVRERLGAVTATWFAQADFTDVEILKEFQESLQRDSHAATTLAEEVPIGLSIREIIHEFKWQTLVLVKALLLQRKMLFFGTKCERLCLMQFALLSLVPNLMHHLQDCADPALDTYAKTITRAGSLRTSERNSLLSYMGLPLQIFGEHSFFSPYTPLQQLDLLMDASTHSFVIGSTNNLILAQKDRYCDILVDTSEEVNMITIINPALRNALALSAADRRWIDNITQTVGDTWDPANPSRPNTHGYAGSEDAIRLQFEEYILSLLSSSAYNDHCDVQPIELEGKAEYADPVETSNDFNNEFLTIWRQSANHQLFKRLTLDARIFDIIEPKHPTAGGLNIEDVQRRLAQGVAELHLDERVREGRETVGRVLGEGKERVGAGVARFWKEVDDFRQRREGTRSREQSQQPSTDPAAIRDNITNVDTAQSPAGKTSMPSTPVVSAWATSLREKASKVQIQKPEINTAQISSAARDNAAKAGQYLSSWGSWARNRSKEWSEARSAGGSQETSATDQKRSSL